MSYARFAQAIAPLSYRPDAPKAERPKPQFTEPYLRGAILRVTSLPRGVDYQFEVGDTFVVGYVEPSFSPEQYGEFYYEDADGNWGMWSNYVECIEE